MSKRQNSPSGLSVALIAGTCVTSDVTGNAPPSVPTTEAQLLTQLKLARLDKEVFVRESHVRSKNADRQAEYKERMKERGIRNLTLPVPVQFHAAMKAVAKDLPMCDLFEPQTVVIIPERLAAVVDLMSDSPLDDPILAMEDAWYSSLDDGKLNELERNGHAQKLGENLQRLTGWRKSLVERVLGIRIDAKLD